MKNLKKLSTRALQREFVSARETILGAMSVRSDRVPTNRYQQTRVDTEHAAAIAVLDELLRRLCAKSPCAKCGKEKRLIKGLFICRSCYEREEC